MIEYISKNILVNCGFKFVGFQRITDNIIYNVFVYDGIDYKEANYKFNKVNELFKNDIKEIKEQTGINYKFIISNDEFIIKVEFN